jgi:hypothetical protein
MLRMNGDSRLGLRDLGGSRRRDGLLWTKRRAKMCVQSGLVAWVRLDQGIDQCMLRLKGQPTGLKVAGLLVRARQGEKMMCDSQCLYKWPFKYAQ